MDLNKDNMKKVMLLIAFTVVIFVCFQNIDVVINTFKALVSLLSPFILGGCIAFILNVPMRVIEKAIFRGDRLKKVKRPISILITLVFVIGIIFIVMFIILPELANTIGVLVGSFDGFVERVQTLIMELTEKYPELQEYVAKIEIDWNAIGKNALGYAKSFSSGIFNSTIGVLTSIVSGLTNFIIGFVFSIYVLSQKENLSRQGKKVLYSYLPEKRADRIISVLTLSENTFANFLSGQCTEAIILGSMFFVSMTILRFPYALLVGVLIAFTALIPIFGAFIGCFIGTFLILMVDPMQAVWFFALFNVLQQIEGNLIYPHVVGSSVGLPSIWVLFAVTVGGNLMGIPGMLLFIPICSVIYVLLRSAVNKRLRKREIAQEKFEPKALKCEFLEEKEIKRDKEKHKVETIKKVNLKEKTNEGKKQSEKGSFTKID